MAFKISLTTTACIPEAEMAVSIALPHLSMWNDKPFKITKVLVNQNLYFSLTVHSWEETVELNPVLATSPDSFILT